MNLEQAIRERAGGSIFSVTFTKRTTGKTRTLVGRLRVTQGVTGKGLRYEPSDKDLMTVYDMHKSDWRMIPLDAVQTLTIRGKTYTPKQLMRKPCEKTKPSKSRRASNARSR